MKEDTDNQTGKAHDIYYKVKYETEKNPESNGKSEEIERTTREELETRMKLNKNNKSKKKNARVSYKLNYQP